MFSKLKLIYIKYKMLLTTILLVIFYQVFYELYWRYLVKPNFKGKVIMVTGASSGIGEQLAK